MSRLSIIRIFFFLFSLFFAKHIAARSAPQVVAIFPLGLAKGSSSQIEIIGRDLEGVYGVWSASQGLMAEVKKVERVSADEGEIADRMGKREGSYRVTVELRVDASAQIGRHSLRVVSPQGMSNAHPFVVTNSPVALESATKEAGKNLQPISVPIILSGRLQEKGETDYFAFDAKPGEAISFHAVSNQATKSGGFDAMQITLYGAGGSWFDRNRSPRLRFSDDARMTYKFAMAGRYLLQVSGFLGISGPDVVYLLNIAPADSKLSTELPQLQTPGIELVKREFSRNLEVKRLETLLSRTVANPSLAVNGQVALSTGTVGKSTEPGTAETSPHLVTENLSKHEADRLESLPLFLEGAIDRSGKIDSYKLMLKAGQQLAFEIETPDTTLPEFSPKLDLLDADGQEVFNNIWRRVGGDNNQWMKTLQAKTMYTFNKDGEYTLRLQDMTPRNSNSSFKYRILVRPVIPHVGKIEVKEDSLNLAPGQAKKLTVTVEQEEGYSGEVALSLENLPKGLQSSTAAEVPPDPEPLLDQGKRDQYVPKSQKVTLLLIGSEDAPATTLPQVVRLVARPVVQGQVGAPVWAKEIPVMVLQAHSEERAVKRPNR